MQLAAYLFPWDVVGDPAAPEQIAALGLDHVVVAAAYHATRAVTPRHPGHRLVTAPYSAAYFTIDEQLWRRGALRLGAASWTGAAGAFEQCVAALEDVGVAVHAWVVLNHVDLPTAAAPTVVNAFGDTYPWALCPSQDAVLEYGASLAATVAGLPGVGGLELEAAGWFGVDHPAGHDKVGAVPLSFAERYLMSLCFCAACVGAYERAGIDPSGLRGTVHAALRPAFDGQTRPHGSSAGAELAEVDALLGGDLAAAVAGVRRDVAEHYRAVVLAAIRRQRADGPVLLHVNPRPQRSAAFTGIAPAAARADGIVVNCWTDYDNLTSTVDSGVSVYASLLAVAGLGGHPGELSGRVASARAAGAAGIRLYHAGLATDADLAAVRGLAPIPDRERKPPW
jgi:hypothetical protein